MKKILIALDYDITAEKVAREGYEIARAMQASVILVHVVNDPAYYAGTSYSPVMGFTGFSDADLIQPDLGLLREAKRYLEECRRHLADDSIEILALEGDFTEAITSTIASHEADLLVMGTHNRHGIDKLIMSNLAAKMLDHIAIPLLAIPTINPGNK